MSEKMFTGADKAIRASTVADEHCGSLSWREGCRWTKSPAKSRGATMFRIASPLPRPPILAALIVVGLYLSAASPAEAVEPVIRSTAASWSALDPSLELGRASCWERVCQYG